MLHSDLGHFLQTQSKSQTRFCIFRCAGCCFYDFVAVEIFAFAIPLGHSATPICLEQKTHLNPFPGDRIRP